MEKCAEWGWFHPLWFIVPFLLFLFIMSRFWWGGWRDRGDWRHHGPDPLNHLKTRYAKGEITKDDFEKMKKDLQD